MGLGSVEPPQQEERHDEFRKGRGEGDAADPQVIIRTQEEQRCHAQERQERDDREQ
jgi:hypothetical protein